MKKGTFVPLVAATVLASALLAGNAVAGPHHMGRGYHNGGWYGPAQQAISPEKQQAYDAIMKDFAKKTQELRDKLQAKQIELDTLGNSTNPNPEAVAKAAQELVTLRNQMNKEREALAERLNKEIGAPLYPGAGYMNGCPGGYGCWGYGPGMMNGDMGPGPRGYHQGYGYHGRAWHF